MPPDACATWARARAALPRQAWPGETWLKDHSLLYHWLRFRLVKASAALAVRRARPPAPEWLTREPALPISRVPPDELQRALASSADFRLRYHLFLLEAMEREARARGVPMRTLLVAHSGETRPADPALAGLHAACAARGEACFDSARVISAAERARFTFAHDSHWNCRGPPPNRRGSGRLARGRTGAAARTCRKGPRLSL